MTLLMRPEPFALEFARFFDTLATGNGTGNGNGQRWLPAMDLVEADDHFLLTADLPGLGPDDVAIEVQDRTLTISGERNASHERKEKGFVRLERSFGKFSRTLTLPEGVDADRIAAAFGNGVLELTIPKPEERKPRRISIQDGGGASRQPAIEGSATDA